MDNKYIYLGVDATPAPWVRFVADTPGDFTIENPTVDDLIRLTAGDFDGDGDVDLAAGSLAMEAVPDQGRMAGWLKNGLPFIVWENRRLEQ